MSARGNWPDGRRFGFTIVDDTDHATVENVRPIYEMLAELGLRTTKTVWALPTEPGAQYEDGATLADADYRAFVLDLRDRGFEIALHGVRGCSSRRETIVEGLERFREVLGAYPAMHVNHAYNVDNLHWGVARFSRFRRALRLYRGHPGESRGHEAGSPYDWGDLAKTHVRYVRGEVFRDIDTLARDRRMPYFDPHYPCVNGWFSASDGANVERFVRLIGERNQARLERAGGLSIVYTHFGTPGFLGDDGRPHPEVRRRLAALAARPGWFRPAGEILDHLDRHSPGPPRTRPGSRPLGTLDRLRLLANRWTRR